MKTRRYLNRVTVTILFLVFIPAIILSVFIWRRAYKELENSNEVYYDQVVHSFAGDFEDRISVLQEHALSIVLDSKQSKSVFHEGLKSAGEHPFWYYRAVVDMKELYPQLHASYCGIYYYDTDWQVGAGSAFPSRYYLYGLDIRDPSHKAWSFFSEERYTPGSWIFSSTYTDPEKNAYVLAGYCTELGKDRDKVMIFYALSRDNYAQLQTVVYEHSGIHFLVLGSGEEDVLMSIGNSVSNSTAYRCSSKWLPLTYEIRVSDSSPAVNTGIFYKANWVTPIILTVILAVACVASVIIVYRPVFSLTAELGKPDCRTDEIGSIRNALGERNAKIMEQENLILDLLLKHLIHGVPISQKVMSRLGVDKSMDHYCVFVTDGYVLPASEVEKLSEKVETDLSARLFCTDWQGENKSILVLFQNGADISGVKTMLSQWLQFSAPAQCVLRTGTVVDSLDSIRDSFLFCLEESNAHTQGAKPIDEEIDSLADRDKQQKELEKQVLEYLETCFRDPGLSQVKVADTFKISTYTLSRLFKNQVGIGFAEYVNSKRLEYAKDLLLTTSCSIKEVAQKSGYASESYFGRIFKATYGSSPSAFREQ